MTNKKPLPKGSKTDPYRSARLGWINGGAVDERFPEERVHAAIAATGQKIDLELFDAFFSEAVGRYRLWDAGQKTTPQTSEEIAHIRKLTADIESVRQRIGHLPPHTQGALSGVMLKAREQVGDGYELERRLSADLMMIGALLKATEREIKKYSGRRGRKPSTLRDRLLADTAAKLTDLGMTGKENSRRCAAAILFACGIDVPDEGRTRPDKKKRE